MLQRLRSLKYILFLLVVGLGVFIYYTYSKNKGVILVERVEIEEIAVERTVSGSGNIKSVKQANLSFPSPGRLTNINVSKGEFVTEGKLLAQVYGYSSYQNAQAAKDARDMALREKDLFIEQYEDDKDLVGGKTVYDIRLRTLDEAISQAEANYQASLGQLTNLYINAPFSGTVVDVFYEVGESVGLGTPVITIADINNLVFEMNINQEDYGVLREGQHVKVFLDAYDDVEIDGEVFEMPKYAESGSDFTIKVRINTKADVNVLLGMTGDGTITIEQSEDNTKALLFDKIFDDENGSYIWVERDNKAEKRYIEVGLRGDLYTEVLTDLSDETIIVPVQDGQIEDGSVIRFNS